MYICIILSVITLTILVNLNVLGFRIKTINDLDEEATTQGDLRNRMFFAQYYRFKDILSSVIK